MNPDDLEGLLRGPDAPKSDLMIEIRNLLIEIRDAVTYLANERKVEANRQQHKFGAREESPHEPNPSHS